MLEILHQPDTAGYEEILKAIGVSEPVVMEAKGGGGVEGYLIYSFSTSSKPYMPPDTLKIHRAFWGGDLQLLDGLVRAVYLKGALKGVKNSECGDIPELKEALETLGLTDSSGRTEIEKVLSGGCGSKKCKKSC